MALSSDLISQFVKITNDDTKKPTETTVYGTIKISDGKPYVQIDGSTMYTPISSTTDAKDGDRVTVLIKDHSAVVTGNLSAPSATKDNVDKVEKDLGDRLDEFDIIVADKVSTEQLDAVKGDIKELTTNNLEVREKLTAAEADIDKLESDYIVVNEQLIAHSGKFDEIDTTFINVSGQITAANAKIENLEATNADFRNLEADYGSFKDLTTDKLEANDAAIESLQTDKLSASEADIKYATIDKLDAAVANIDILEADYGEFKTLSTEKLNATEADIQKLETDKLSAKDAELTYANIDFTNISKATMEWFYANSGLIEDVVIGDGTITGNLIGVTIKGDLIEGGTVVADKLVILGDDGLYYKLNTNGVTTETEQTDYNSLNGSIITAKSITATKISVDDLVAFDATIGGFNIGEKSIYSGVKETVDNTTRGIYLDNEGQIAFGDASNFIKYYKDSNGDYHLEISAESMIISGSKTSVETLINDAQIAVDKVNDLEERANSGEFAGEDATTLRIDSSRGTVFKNNSVSTVLSAVIYKGSKRITDIATLKNEYGTSAYLEWSWQRMGEDSFGTIVSTDSRIGNNGFTFTLSSDDVDTKVVFMCQLITD